MSGITDVRAFVDALRLERLRLRMKQGTLARRIGVTQAALCRWEVGHNLPTMENARAWCAALDLAPPPALAGWFESRAADCGTTGGYQRHRRREEPYCDRCRDANTAAMRAWRAGRAS